jgi:hypothetical protein
MPATKERPSVKCPGCNKRLDENDLHNQRQHMLAAHPKIVEQRLRESARWDGWENG